MRLWWILLLISASGVSGQTLALRDAAAAALATHPVVTLASSSVERAEAAYAESRSARLPGASLETSATRFELPMVVAPLHGFDPQSPPVFDRTLLQGAVNVTWQAFDGGSRRARIDGADAQRSAAAAAELGALQSLIADVVRAFTAVVSARELLSAQDARVSALEQERMRAARLLDEGRAARVLLLRAEAALSAARAERARAGAELDAAERQLARMIGWTPEFVRDASLSGAGVRGDAPDRDRIAQRALEQNPELKRLESSAAAARHVVREARAQWWPRLGLGGRYVRYASGAGDSGGEWQAGAQLQYPLFTGGARDARGDRATAELRLADADVAAARLRVMAAVDDAWSAYVSASMRAEAWRAAVEQNSEVVRIERLALDTGAGVQTDYLSAEAELMRARAELEQADAAELVARVELARIAGELSLEWIERNVEPGT